MYEEAIEVAEEILLYHDNDKRLLKLVSDVYMKNIDDRTSCYKKEPNFLLMRNLKTTAPEKVYKEMDKLICYYHKNKGK